MVTGPDSDSDEGGETAGGAATAAARSSTAGPLVIERQGSFFAGGTVQTNPGDFDPSAFYAPPVVVRGAARNGIGASLRSSTRDGLT